MAPAQRAARARGTAQARTGAAQVAAARPAQRYGRLRRQCRARSRPAADDRGLRPPQLADAERRRERARVRQRRAGVLVVFGLLVVGDREDELVALRTEARGGDAHEAVGLVPDQAPATAV